MANVSIGESKNLLARLDPDRNQAAEKYELLRRKLIKTFERRNLISAAGKDGGFHAKFTKRHLG